MIPIPAIDLKGGKVVRLLQGKFDAEKVYGDDPASVARNFQADGAVRIHVVDLDGALSGEPKNLAGIERILAAVKVPVEIGGGIRRIEQARRYLEMGARWVVFGTRASLDPGFLREAVAELKEQAIIGIDAKDGFVAVDGWTKVLPKKAAALAKTVEDEGGRSVIYTDISRDGALAGPNLGQLKELASTIAIDVIASGGVGSIEDLRSLKGLSLKNLRGVIIGKAIYENKFSVGEAVRACSQNA